MFKKYCSKLKNLNNKKYILLLSIIFLLSIFVIQVLALKNVVIVNQGKKTEIKTLAFNVNNVLKEQNIKVDRGVKVVPAINEKITENMVIKIGVPVDIKFLVDGKEKMISLVEPSVEDILKTEGIILGNLDKIEENITKESSPKYMNIIRVKKEEVSRKEDIPFKTVITEHRHWPIGKEAVLQKGITGMVEKIYVVTYENGKKVNVEEKESKIIKEVKDKIIAYGSNTSMEVSSRSFDNARKMHIEATAYTHTGNRTATGIWPRKGIVAVDPKVIPLGTKMYIEGYGYAEAQDTGGAIKGDIIDVFLDNEETVRQWGRKKVNIYLLN